MTDRVGGTANVAALPGRAAGELIDVPPGKVASIVTSLEMLAPPSRRPDVDGCHYRLQRSVRPDLAWYRELFARVGSEWLWFSRLQLADEELRKVLHDAEVEVYTAQDGSVDVGLLELDFRETGTCELAFFGLQSSSVGKGAGRWLMNRALEIVWSRPINRFWVHTCTHDHPAAVQFYIRSGFRPFRQQVEIEDDPRLLGTLPRHVAGHVPLLEPADARSSAG